jgi:hypothetical protein
VRRKLFCGLRRIFYDECLTLFHLPPLVLSCCWLGLILLLLRGRSAHGMIEASSVILGSLIVPIVFYGRDHIFSIPLINASINL